MKKFCFIIISVIIITTLFVGYSDVNNRETPSPGATTNCGEIPLPTFSKYNDYLEYISSRNLPENFVHAREFFNLGTFCRAVFLDRPEAAYIYTYTDEQNHEISLTFKCLPEGTSNDIKQYLTAYYKESIAKDHHVFMNYSESLFVNENLLECNNGGVWTVDMIVENIDYCYLGGILSSINFIKDDFLCTISWGTVNPDKTRSKDGTFLLESNNAVSKMIKKATVRDGLDEISNKINVIK